MRDQINQEALFSDETGYYRSPSEPRRGDPVTIKFRTAHENVDTVTLICGSFRQKMKRSYSQGLFDYYVCEWKVLDEPVHYFFEILSGEQKLYFDKLGVVDHPQEAYSFCLIPDFHTPHWAKGAVMYQIYTDRFCNGNPSNDVKDREYRYLNRDVHRVTDWNQLPEVCDVQNFYGGDLQGVWQKLDYLQEMGVEVLYLNPVFVSPSNHKYDTQDYDYIDPHLTLITEDGGTPLPDGAEDNRQAKMYRKRVVSLENLEASNAWFAGFLQEIHRRGMKVILDGVFNHCGSFHKWLDRERLYEEAEGFEKGAYVSADSPYRNYFRFQDEQGWPCNGSYEGWWGYETLPKLNYEASEELKNYVLVLAQKWLKAPYFVDGWRLDVAADLGQSQEYNHYFWKEFRRNVKEANPEAIVLAEHYGDPTSWLQGDQWDTVMNYDAFMEPITWFLTGVEKHSDEYREDLLGNADAFFGSMRNYMTRFNTQSLQVAMNELSNHDHSRFMTRTNHKVGRTASVGPQAADEGIDKALFRLGVMIQMTWPGAPTIYYGDEAGLCGWTDPDNRRTYPWGREDNELIEFHRQLIRIHKDYQVFKTGSIMFLKGQYKLIGYGRFDENDKIVVMINSSDEVREADIPVWRMGIIQETRMARLMLSDREGYSDEAKVYPVVNGLIHVECPPMSGMIIKDIESMG